MCCLSSEQVPARAAAAAAVARAIAGLPPHQRFGLSSSSQELSSIYGSTPQGPVVEEIEEEFYEEVLLISIWFQCGSAYDMYCPLMLGYFSIFSKSLTCFK